MAAAEKGHVRNYRRYRGYDYGRGATLFVTVATSPRSMAFGRIELIAPSGIAPPGIASPEGRCFQDNGGCLESAALQAARSLQAMRFQAARFLSPAGVAAEETLRREAARNPAITVMRHCVMPDHIHVMLHVRAGEAEPLKAVGRFVGNMKRWIRHRCRELGLSWFGWQPNYHDRICSTRVFMDRVARYIDDNPLKWALMHGPNPPMKVAEPLSDPRLPSDEWWSGVGNAALLRGRLAAVRLSRSLPPAEHSAVAERLLRAAEDGWTLASTFISPLEREVAAELDRRRLPFVRMVPDELATVYRPVGSEPRMFAEGRYLLLSRAADPSERRQDQWHGINAALSGIAVRNGVAVYVRHDPRKGTVWDFNRTAGNRTA